MGSDIDVNSEPWVWPSSSFSLGGSDEHRQEHHQRSDQDARRQVKQFLKWFMQSLPLNSAVLQDIGTCGEVENPDRRLSLGPHRHPQERPQPGGVELHMATDCFDHSVQEDDLSASSFQTPTSKPKSAAAIPNQIYLCSNWTSSIVHGIRDEKSVRVQPRNEGIIVCAFL